MILQDNPPQFLMLEYALVQSFSVGVGFGVGAGVGFGVGFGDGDEQADKSCAAT